MAVALVEHEKEDGSQEPIWNLDIALNFYNTKSKVVSLIYAVIRKKNLTVLPNRYRSTKRRPRVIQPN